MAVQQCEQVLLSDKFRDRVKGSETPSTTLHERVTLTGLAYHAQAVELDTLGRTEKAMEMYTKAFRMIKNLPKQRDELHQRIRKSYMHAKRMRNRRNQKPPPEKFVPNLMLSFTL